MLRRLYLLAIIALALIPAHTLAQTAFNQLPDATGFADNIPQHILDSLESASQSLREALPQQFQSDFGVYDLGFYSHHGSFTGGIPDVMATAIDSRISSSYYLLFGREFNADGDLERVWVEVELPEGEWFSCLEPPQKEFHVHMVRTFVNSPAIIGDNNSFLYMEQINASFNYLKGVFAGLESCCDQQGGFRSVPQCSHCPQDVNDFRSFMEANGFVGIEVENLVASTYYDTTGNIREYTELTLELAGEPLDVNEDVIGFLHRMDNAMEGVYGSLYYYDPLDPHCEKIMEVVSGTYSLPVAFQESGVSRSAAEEAVLEITTIGTVDEDGGEMVHVNVNIPIQMTNDDKTIYLKCVEDCGGYNISSIQSYLTNFYSLLGKYPGKIFPDGIVDSVDLIPDIQIATQRLTKEIVQGGAIVLFGKASHIIYVLQHADYYLDMAGYWGYDEGRAGICRLIHKPRHPHAAGQRKPPVAMGQLGQPRRFSLVTTNYIESEVIELRSNNKDHAAAFLAMHETGHNAGIEHWHPSGVHCNGYMSDGEVLKVGYLKSRSGATRYCCCLDNYASSPEKLILDSFNSEKHNVDLSHIKKAIYERFIK